MACTARYSVSASTGRPRPLSRFARAYRASAVSQAASPNRARVSSSTVRSSDSAAGSRPRRCSKWAAADRTSSASGSRGPHASTTGSHAPSTSSARSSQPRRIRCRAPAAAARSALETSSSAASYGSPIRASGASQCGSSSRQRGQSRGSSSLSSAVAQTTRSATTAAYSRMCSARSRWRRPASRTRGCISRVRVWSSPPGGVCSSISPKSASEVSAVYSSWGVTPGSSDDSASRSGRNRPTSGTGASPRQHSSRISGRAWTMPRRSRRSSDSSQVPVTGTE
ncbi:hypothetical protein RKD25_002062 [Streptomyces sp. SAI-124]